MLSKLLEIYKIYFLISFIVAVILIIGNYESGWLTVLLIILGALITPFIYELDYFLYIYIVDPTSSVSQNILALLKNKNYTGAFLYAHENSSDFDNAIFRSILMVISIFALAFLIVFSPVNIVAQTLVLAFLLTTLYLETLSFTDGSWKTWYSFFDWVPKEKVAKAFLGLQYIIFVVFIFQVL